MPTPHDPLRLLHLEEVRNLLEPGTPEKGLGRDLGRESEQESAQGSAQESEFHPDR